MLLKAIVKIGLTLAQTQALASTCLDGYYDLGPDAAALGFQCKEASDETSSTEAFIVFCKRSTLLNSGHCTGARQPIDCNLLSDEKIWQCEEKHPRYPFLATVQEIEPGKVLYTFKSSFNQGQRTGFRVTVPHQSRP